MFKSFQQKDDDNQKLSDNNYSGTMLNEDFKYIADSFADIQILRYKLNDFNNLTLKQQKLVYYLIQAGLSGRDIFWDQNYKYNLTIRDALENIYLNYNGDKQNSNWNEFLVYLKRVWFSNGIHHHYSNIKIKPNFSKEYFLSLLNNTNTKLSMDIVDIIFNDEDNKKVNLDLNKGLIEASAVNFYSSNLSTKDVQDFYAQYSNSTSNNDINGIEFGLNSKLVKNKEGKLEEQVWKSGGLYSEAIEKIIFWLEKAVDVAENSKQEQALKSLIKYFQTGDVKVWRDYNIAWLNATEGDIDYILGFIEVYNDPLGHKGSFESIVQIKDFDMTKKMEVLSKNASWFEENSPIDKKYKKDNVIGISYKSVNVAGESGDASPSSPIGVNLPNADYLRAKYGSKSVSLDNLINAYDKSSGDKFVNEFALTDEEKNRSKKYVDLSSKLHTALHEVIGHASGKIAPGVKSPKETLQNYQNTLEEGRADLVGLYYIYNPKIQELGLTDNWQETAKAEYDAYIRNGLIGQLVRIELGDNVEEDHMRNRQLISKWVYEKGEEDNIIEYVKKNSKTYVKINDYKKLHDLFGSLLREVQRIKSEGDYNAAKDMVEKYGVKINAQLHQEILARYEKLQLKPYKGFINPKIIPIVDNNNIIKSFKVEYPESFIEQMIDYSKNYHYLKQ